MKREGMEEMKRSISNFPPPASNQEVCRQTGLLARLWGPGGFEMQSAINDRKMTLNRPTDSSPTNLTLSVRNSKKKF